MSFEPFSPGALSHLPLPALTQPTPRPPCPLCSQPFEGHRAAMVCPVCRKSDAFKVWRRKRNLVAVKQHARRAKH